MKDVGAFLCLNNILHLCNEKEKHFVIQYLRCKQELICKTVKQRRMCSWPHFCSVLTNTADFSSEENSWKTDYRPQLFEFTAAGKFSSLRSNFSKHSAYKLCYKSSLNCSKPVNLTFSTCPKTKTKSFRIVYLAFFFFVGWFMQSTTNLLQKMGCCVKPDIIGFLKWSLFELIHFTP